MLCSRVELILSKSNILPFDYISWTYQRSSAHSFKMNNYFGNLHRCARTKLIPFLSLEKNKLNVSLGKFILFQEFIIIGF